MTEGRWPEYTPDFSSTITWATHGGIPIVFSVEQANEAMSEALFNYMICIDIPRAQICRTVADAVIFFNQRAEIAP
jgi:hypothetical protein